MSSRVILDFLDRCRNKRLALVGHARPDGDALGSCIGFAHVLRSVGYEASVVNISPVPSNLEFLISDIVVRHDASDWRAEYDCVGILDCGELDRVDEKNREAAETLPAFNMDHHISSRGIGRAIWIAPEASSTGEMVVQLCREAGWRLTADAAQALWTAIITDTGRFSYENTSVPALAAAMDCLAAGAVPHAAAGHVYQSITLAKRCLQALVLSRMELLESGKLAVSWLLRRDFDEAGIGVEEGTQDLIGLLRETKGVDVAVFLYETGRDVKVSMRTASPYNAIRVVEKFGGGGHMRAAGCSLPVSVENAKIIVVNAIRETFFSAGETRRETNEYCS